LRRAIGEKQRDGKLIEVVFVGRLKADELQKQQAEVAEFAETGR
jgi:hypothetical protein